MRGRVLENSEDTQQIARWSRIAVSSLALLTVVACVSQQSREFAQEDQEVPDIVNADLVKEAKVAQNPKMVFPQVSAEVALQQPEAAMNTDSLAGMLMAVRHGRVTPQHVFTPHLPIDAEKYAHYDKNPISSTVDDPVSTFSVDVDTGSYSLVRDRLNQGRLPHPDAVRTEELINYFAYDYPQPTGATPFSITTDALETPWNKNTYLLRIGLQGKKIIEEKRPPANLVMLLDVSGSMNAPDKLPLLTRSLSFMAGQLTEEDRVSIVVYAGAAGLVLDVTKGTDTVTIRNALNGLRAGGSTAGGAGIQLAYQKAREAYIEGGINRILLATDGDFNVGVSGVEELKAIIEENRKSGISLSTLGFGDGNYNDHLMEQVADVGNGNYAYIDNFREAKKVLGDQLSATIHTIAKDVKVQVEFNPAVVAEYRLIGYENRVLADEDFENDKVDAGEIGAGHSVTALYEVALVGSKGLRLPERRYGDKKQPVSGKQDELGFVKLRFKEPDGAESKLVSRVMKKNMLREERVSKGLMHAAAVAAYGQLLAEDKYLGDFGFDDAAKLARRSAEGGDHDRAEFIALIESAKELKEMQASGR